MKSTSIFVLGIVLSYPVVGLSSDEGKKLRPGEGLVKPKTLHKIITVGGAGTDLPAYTSRAIQLALDALQKHGGGTVQLSPGTYDIRGPIRLSSNTTLVGSGEETVLRKGDGFRTRFIVDADYGMYKITVEDPSGFEVGMGVQLYDDEHGQGWDVTTAVITAIEDNVLYLDNRTLNDYIASLNGTISNAFPIVGGVEVENVRIANLTIDGNKESNDYINGCRGGGVYLHKSRDSVVDRVRVRNFNGDSFSWQITENITVRNSEASYGTGLGFHPGTGSRHSVVEDNVSHHHEQDGFFLCWRVQHGTFQNNLSFANQRFGISIGHQDTDNLFLNNHIYENGRDGIYFRDETEQNGGHRNTFRQNVVENNGNSAQSSYGFYIGGRTHDIVIEDNTIRSTGAGNQVGAVFVGADSKRIEIKANRISGHQKIVRESGSQ